MLYLRGKASNDTIEFLVREHRGEVQKVIRGFRELTVAKRRNYGSAALFLIAALELAIARERGQ